MPLSGSEFGLGFKMPPFAVGLKSKIMLSGQFASPETPPERAAQVPTEYIHPADTLPDQRIVRGPVQKRVPMIRDFRIDRIAMLQAIQGTAGLHGRK
jgi:hypothetical protein